MNNQLRVRLFTVGTDTAKDRIFARLKIPAHGPGYIHLPDFIDEEYLAQLTAEKAVRRYKRGRGTVREYIKTRSRNEALDLEVYALAALYTCWGRQHSAGWGNSPRGSKSPAQGADDGGKTGGSGGDGGARQGPISTQR